MKRYTIGIDVGTTTIKAVFLDTVEHKIASTQTEEIFPVKTENPEYLEYDPLQWKEHIQRILKRGFDTGIDPAQVAGVCVGGFTVQALFVKKDGAPVTNSIHYNDMRHLEILDELDALLGGLPVERNGNYLGMYAMIAKRYWWKEKRPEVFRAAELMATETSYVNFLLTGEWKLNRTEAGFCGEYNAHTRGWDDEIIAKMGFPRSLYPQLVDAWEVAGHVTARAAAEFGLAEGTPVLGGVDDASPVAIATGVVQPGQGYMSAGSGANIAASAHAPISHPTIITYPHCLPGLFMGITVMSSTGLSYKWMRNAFAQAEAARAELSGGDAYDYMNEMAAAVAPGARGVVFLPYLDGDYTPNNDADARGVFLGMDTATTKGELYRATLEGVAFATRDNIELIRGLGGEVEELVITGGLARSALWMQIMADVTGCCVSLPEETEGAPLGSAIIAAVACGAYESFDDAIGKAVRIRKNAFVPEAGANAVYRDLYKVYKSLYPRLKDPFRELADIRKKYNL